MKESYFWKTVRDGILHVHWSRIENIAGTGIPDLNGCYMGREVWVELKMFSGKQIQVRSSQLVWMTKRIQVLLMARHPSEIWMFEGHDVVSMAMDRAISKSLPDGKGVAMTPPRERTLAIFPKPFDWDAIRKLLFSK